jgi:hypothetical protein
MDRDAYAKGVEAAKADVAAGRLQYRWHGHSGHWVTGSSTNLRSALRSELTTAFGICFVSESQISFDDGYNATLACEINRRHGDGAFEAVFAESRKQSEEALRDAKRAWLDRHAQA